MIASIAASDLRGPGHTSVRIDPRYKAHSQTSASLEETEGSDQGVQ